MTQPSHMIHQQRGKIAVGCAIVTVSDTRTEETDKSGKLIKELLNGQNHLVQAYHIVPDEPKQIRPLLVRLLAEENVDAVILNGGTGVSHRDVTFDTVKALLEKELPGFGELFRMLSYEEIGTAALLSRATAGTIGRRVVFSVPGSSGAVKLAMERLILPEVGHIVAELRK